MARETPQQKQAREGREHRTDKAEDPSGRVARGRDAERAEGARKAVARRADSGRPARQRY
jgi:hypothetical protein